MAIYGTIQSQQIKIEIMISVPLVRNLGEAFRETWQGEHLIILVSHPFQELLPMLFSPQSKHWAKKVFFPDAYMVPHKIKTRPSMCLIWQWATKETHASTPTVELATFLAVGYCKNGAQTLLPVLKNYSLLSLQESLWEAWPWQNWSFASTKVETPQRKGENSWGTSRRALLRQWKKKGCLLWARSLLKWFKKNWTFYVHFSQIFHFKNCDFFKTIQQAEIFRVLTLTGLCNLPLWWDADQ